MDRIRVQPGYYSGRNDPLFKAEIIKYFEQVSRADSIFKIAYDDYHNLSTSTWNELYGRAFHLTSG